MMMVVVKSGKKWNRTSKEKKFLMIKWPIPTKQQKSRMVNKNEWLLLLSLDSKLVCDDMIERKRERKQTTFGQ